MDTANLSIEQLETRIRVTKEQIRRFADAFSARINGIDPPNVPLWALKAELDGIRSILIDLQVELFQLEQERWKCGISTGR
jgi:hypothetical protein